MSFGTPFDQDGETTWELSVEDTASGVVLSFTTKANPSQWVTKGDTAVKAAFQKIVTALDGETDLAILAAYQHHPRTTDVTP